MTTALKVVMARTLISAVVFDALVPLSPFIAQDLNVSAAYFQSMLALCLAVFALSQWLSTPLINRAGASLSLATGSTLVALLCLATTFTASRSMLSIALIAMFAANALATTASRLWLHQHLGQTKFQSTTAYLYAGISVLAALGPLVLMLSASAWGWRGVMGTLAGGLLVVSLWLFFQRTEEPRNPLGSTAATALWRQSRFVSALLMGILIQSAFTPLNLSKAFILDGVFQLSTSTIGAILSAWAAVVASAFFAAGKAVAYFTEAQRLKVGLLVQGLGAIGMVAAWFQYDLSLYLFAAASTSFAFCILLPLTIARALDVAPSQQAGASAVFGSVTVATAGLTTGLGAQMHASLFFILMLVLGVCALGLLLLNFIHPGVSNCPSQGAAP